MKAARRYPVTANAMDAAAIATLFATFFSAHALWNLIPALVTFGLLALVTALAVILSIRRESLFIAVLGLLGGFATPALLSTGENRPIPLFAYLLLLNVGLAWVAYAKRWPVLTGLTLLLTTIYQWGWVLKFLDTTSVPLAMGVFLLFPLAAVAGLMFASGARGAAADKNDRSFEQTALVSAAMPLLFALYLAAVPAYGTRPSLLFGFLLLVDAGLLAIAIARRQGLLHAVGALATMLVMATWMAMWVATWILATRARPSQGLVALGFTALFSVFYVVAPVVAGWLARPLTGAAARAHYAAPLLLTTFPVLAAIEPSFVAPWPLMGTLLALVVLIAWRAVASGSGSLYYIAAFFAIAAQAVWSAVHLSLERLGTAVGVYVAFGLVSLAVPVVARRMSRALQPASGGGVVLLFGLTLLFFLSLGPVAPAALWALALLLAIMNAALFIESAAGRLPTVAQVGSILSWVLMMTWWSRAAGAVGVLPSLLVVVGLTLVTLAGHCWAVRVAAGDGEARQAPFVRGLYLGLIGHVFLMLLATDREWSLPPWPLFAALAAVTLGTSAAALWSRVATMHVAGTVAAALVVTAWSAAAGSPDWGLTVVLAAAAVTAYALAWQPLAGRFRPPSPRLRWASGGARIAQAAGAAFVIGEFSLIAAAEGGAMPPFPLLLLAHVINVIGLLALTTMQRWPFVAVGAVVPAWVAVLQWQARIDLELTWPKLLALSAALYAVFAAYPFAVGRRLRESRDPYLAAVLASAMAFFGARAAFVAGGLDWMIGAIPVDRRRCAGTDAPLAAQPRADGAARPRTSCARCGRGAGIHHRRDSAAAEAAVDHDWLGARGRGARLGLHAHPASRAVLLGGGAAWRGVRQAGAEPRSPDLRAARRDAHLELVPLRVSAVRGGHARGRLVPVEDRTIASSICSGASAILPGAAVVLLFLLLNIEIADFYATGPTIMFRFGVTVAQDLTYTIGWLVFGMGLLTVGISLGNRAARVAAVTLIAVTTFKCFLYDLGSLEGLPRVASFVGLAISLALVSLALQKFVLKTRNAT